MKQFEMPEMEVEVFQIEDVITTSVEDPNATPWS